MTRMPEDDRGQVQTIEAFIAAFILLVVLTVVVQATSVTPLTTSFTNQHVKYELQCMGQDILTSLDEIPYQPPALTTETTASMLEKSIRDWLEADYYGSTPPIPTAIPGDWYTYNGVDKFQSATNPAISRNSITECTELEKVLNFAFSESGIAYNVEIRYPDATGNVYCAKMIWNGDPSDNCVTVSRCVALHDPVDAGNPGDADITSTTCLIPDISTGTLVDPTLHNVVEVRLTVWVM